MSTPDGEPMISADYESRQMTRDMTLAWDVPRVAADPEAVKAVLKEYIVRLMFEHGEDGAKTVYSLLWEATHEAKKEYYASKVIKESTSER